MEKTKRFRTFTALLLAVVTILGNALAGTYYIEDGSIEVHASETSQTVSQADNTHEDNAPVISNRDPGTSSANTVTINADDGCTASVTVKDLNIDVSEKDETPAVKTEGAGNVNIELDGSSSLKSGQQSAGLQKENTGSLTINDADQNGKLEAKGGEHGAGIGGGGIMKASNITINGGEIIATGGEFAAGIGGGVQGRGKNITINGGAIIATGGDYAAGIGGGTEDAKNINISGGKVIASGGANSAGIGGGKASSSENIVISGSAQVSAAGGAGEDSYGIGAAIGNGGRVRGEAGTEIAFQASDLTCGSIEYYAPGTSAEDIIDNSVNPTKTVKGTKEHDISTAWTYNDSTHWHTCSESGCVAKINEAAHTWEDYGGSAATCTKNEIKPGKKCKCGKILEEPEEVPNTAGHIWETEWSSDGTKHWHKCTGCTAVKDEAAHNFATFVERTKNPTCTETGTDVYKCTCGATTEVVVEPTGIHTPAAPVKENEKPAQVGVAGSYDEVVYCSACGDELSRKTVTVDPLPEKESKKTAQGNLAAFCADIAKQIRQAPENGTVEADAGSFDCLTRVVFKALGERPDVTLRLQTKEGLILVPAGAGLLEKIGGKNTIRFAELKDMLK